MAFKIALAAKRNEIAAAKRRYEVGLEKLAFATESVNAMQVLIHIHAKPVVCTESTNLQESLAPDDMRLQ